MICKDSVLKWFKGLSSHNRIDLMCSLLNKCLPFELRLIGTCLEDLGRQHFTQMKDFEVKANNTSELSEFQSQSILSDARTRQKLALYVCLLHSLNTTCSTLIYKTLNGIDINEVLSNAKNCDEKLLEELLTIYTVCVNHPAFSFEQRSNLGNTLMRLRQEENRIEAERLAEAANEEYAQAQLGTDGLDGAMPVPGSEIPPPGAPPGMGYPPGLGAAGNFIHIPVSMYPAYPSQQMPHPSILWVNYPLPPAESLPPPFAASPRVSRPSSPTHSASPSRTGSPVRKYPPRLDRADSQPKTRPQYPPEATFINPPPVVKKPFMERVDSASKDGPLTNEDDLRGLNDRMADLSTEEMLRSAAVNLNGVVGPSVRVPLPPRQNPLGPAPYEPEFDVQTGVRPLEPCPVPTGPSVASTVCRAMVLAPGPRFSQHPMCKHSGNALDDGCRNCSSSSGSDASSTSHSPPITPASISQNWDWNKGCLRDGVDIEDPAPVVLQPKVERPRPGLGRGRARFGAPGVQTLPRQRGALPAGTRRDGPRSAPPTPHEDNKGYLVPPPGGELPPPCVTTSVVSPASILSASTVSKPPTHEIMASGMPYPTSFLPGPFPGPPMFAQYPPTFVRPPYTYPNGEVMYSYHQQPAQQPAQFLPSPMVTYSSSVPPPKIACYNCSSQSHHPNDCKEPTMEEYSSKDENMSSVDSAAMSGSEVSEKGPVDFGVKAVSLKSQGDPNRLLQTSGPLRTLPSPSVNRPPSVFSAQHTTIPVLGSIPQKPGFTRATTSSSPGGVPSGRPIVSAAPPPSTYLVPRGAPTSTGLGPRGPPASSRSTVCALQPVSSVQTLVRTPSPISTQSISISSQPPILGWGGNPPMNNLRASSPGSGPPRSGPARTTVTVTGGKPAAHSRLVTESARPLLIHAAPARPLTLAPTAQLHIATDKMKVPVHSVGPILPIRPAFGSTTGFVAQSQPTAILQRTDAGTLQSVGQAGTVLTTPLRLAPSQPPLLTTQRVAVSASSSRPLQQHISVSSNLMSPRGPPHGLTSRAPGTGSGAQGLPKMAVSSMGTGAILTTTGRLTYPTGQVIAAPSPITRISTSGTTVLSSSKPGGPGPTPLVVTAASRMPVPNHQVGKPQRFGAVRTQGPVGSQPLLATSMSPGGLVVHPQLVVSTGKPPSLAANHVTTVRPPPTSVSLPKLINPPLHGPIQISATPVPSSKSMPTTLPATSTQLTPVISKQHAADMYKLAPTSSISSRSVAVVATQAVPLSSSAAAASAEPAPSVYIPAAHRNLTSGIICSQPPLTERTTGAPTLSTYTFPSGTSYFYEAPSGYQLATDSPLVARPLQSDAPLVSRDLSTEGPLIARPFTPGLIASSQTMRFNPVMIVDPSIAPAPVLTAVTSSAPVSGDTLTLTDGPSNQASKITSSPRPSILRKRDSEALASSKAVKNLSGVLSSGSASRSRTPSPPTPPVSLTLETNQPTNDNGPSSNGSTTISATSSPGPEDNLDPDRPPVEMSPRKKPRKQLLNANETNQSIDMEFISGEKMKKEKGTEVGEGCAETSAKVVIMKRPGNLSLLQTYKHSWKARNNHFQRYTDVKPKEERRPSVSDLANQRQIHQRVNGWKIYHLNAQLEDLSDVESNVLDRLSTIFKALDHDLGKELEKDIGRVNDLIMGNIQRSRVIRDQMDEAKTQMMKVFDHKVHVSEIFSRCSSSSSSTKRNFKKRDKY